MSRREVVESTKIVIKTDDGNRLCLEGKGSVVQGMLTAFTLLPVKRRTLLLEKMQAKHAEILEREAERAKEGTAP